MSFSISVSAFGGAQIRFVLRKPITMTWKWSNGLGVSVSALARFLRPFSKYVLLALSAIGNSESIHCRSGSFGRSERSSIRSGSGEVWQTDHPELKTAPKQKSDGGANSASRSAQGVNSASMSAQSSAYYLSSWSATALRFSAASRPT